MTRQEWISSVVGGVIGLALSVNAFLVLPASEIFAVVNLVVFSIGLSILGFLVCVVFYEDAFESKKASRLAKAISWIKAIVTQVLVGAIYGLMFGYFTQIDLRWSILAFAIAWAIPILNVFTIIGSTPVFLLICGIEYGPGLGESFSVLQKMPTSMRWIGAPYFVPLLTIPFLAFLGLVVGNFVEDKVKRARLKLIDERINNLEETIKKHETVLAQKNQMERNIDRIVAIDPPNFGFKATLFRKQANELDTDNVRKRIVEIEGENQKWDQLRKQAEEKLCALEGEKEALERRLKEIRNRLRILEVVDPANIKIKMQKLQTEWEGVRRDDLEKIEVAGELEALFKEQLLLNFQIKEKTSEIEDQRKEVAHLNLTVDALQLEKHVLELEIIDRKIKSEEPYILELRDKLTDLQTKRERIKQSLQHQKQS